MEMYRERSTDCACCHTPPLDVTMIGPIDKRSVNTSHTIAPVLSAIPHPQQQEVLRRCGWNDVFHCNPRSAKLLKDPHTGVLLQTSWHPKSCCPEPKVSECIGMYGDAAAAAPARKAKSVSQLRCILDRRTLSQ